MITLRDRAVIRPIIESDAEAITAIYNHYVLNTVVTFEEEAVATADMLQRIRENQTSGLPWLVAEKDSKIVGYAYAGKWKGRCAYRFTVESTVYLAPESVSKGLGTKLYTALFDELKKRSIHVVIGGIALPNPASVALHEKFGMKKAAHFNEVGFKFGRWVDVGYWQTTLKPDESSNLD